jgi:hypothetical protein
MMKAILTGQSRGLGAAIAADLLGRKIPVLGLSRRLNQDLATTNPKLLQQAAIDLASSDAVQHWLDGSALPAFLKDATAVLLINNAGSVQPIGPSQKQNTGAIALAVSLNVATPLMLTAALAAHCAGRELRVMHISSGAGRNAYAGWNIYCATKAALDHHARAAVLDEMPGLKICSLAPGIIDTDMQGELRASSPDLFPMHEEFVEMKRDGSLVSPADAARKLVSFALSDQFGSEPVADLRKIEL